MTAGDGQPFGYAHPAGNYEQENARAEGSAKGWYGLMFVSVLFGIFALLLVLSALGVIVARVPVHSALFLILCFFSSAALWLLIEAEFLAIVLVLVYVGAVMVLFLFVVMMLDINAVKLREGFTRYAPLGAIVAGLVILQLSAVIWVRSEGLPIAETLVRADADFSNTEALGAVLYIDYVYPFELAAFILLLAIIAAIMLTLRRRPGLKTQDVSAQVAVRRQDRVRIVRMDAEKDS